MAWTGRNMKRWPVWGGLCACVVCTVVILSLEREGEIYRAEPPAQVAAGDRIVVEVLNGCGARGAAKLVALDLRRRGFDVVRIGNAEDFCFQQTVVIDRCGSTERAEEVARALGCERVIQQVAPDAYLEVTVVLGADGIWRGVLVDQAEAQ
jgi:hypothetical protein